MRIPLKPILILASLLIISLAGSLAIYYATTWGPWAFSDSAEYISAARSLLAGHRLGYTAASGDFVLYSLHPPLYPLVLSFLGLLGFDMLVAARWLNILLFGLTVFSSGAFTYTFFRNAWLALASSIALLTIPVFVDASSGAMSEPMLLFASTLAIGLLVLYLGRKKAIFLVLSAFAAALAVLARYPGIVVVIACVLGLLISNRFSWKQRIREVIAFCLVSLTPIAAWLVWLFSQGRSLAERSYLLPSDPGAAIMAMRKSMMEIFISWLPYRQSLPSYNYTTGRNYLLGFIGIMSLLAILLILRRVYKRPVSQNQSVAATYQFLWGLFTIGNILLLAVTFLFTTPTPDLNPRTLLPVQFGTVLFGITLLAGVLDEFQLPQAIALAGGLLVVFFIYPNAQTSWKLIDQYHQLGQGYTSAEWHSSQTLQALRKIPSNTPLITNQAVAVLLYINRAAYDFCSPACVPSWSLRYGDDSQDPAQSIFRQQGAALVLFYPWCKAHSEPSYADSLAQLGSLTKGLRQAFYSCDGAIYYYPTTP